MGPTKMSRNIDTEDFNSVNLFLEVFDIENNSAKDDIVLVDKNEKLVDTFVVDFQLILIGVCFCLMLTTMSSVFCYKLARDKHSARKFNEMRQHKQNVETVEDTCETNSIVFTVSGKMTKI